MIEPPGGWPVRGQPVQRGVGRSQHQPPQPLLWSRRSVGQGW